LKDEPELKMLPFTGLTRDTVATLHPFVVFIPPDMVPFDGTLAHRYVHSGLHSKALANYDSNPNIKQIHSQPTPQIS
jgi:hypothetical protein